MLLIERCGTSLIISINRPEAGNSINGSVAKDLEEAIVQVACDESLCCVIITGSGDKFFCAGGDIKEYRSVKHRDQLDAVMGCTRRALSGLEALDIPVIMAINGYCLGGGFEMMLAGDIRIASATATFSLPQVRLGIIPGWHGIERLVQLVGRGMAVILAAGGETIDAKKAQKVGLVDEVVAECSVLERALEIGADFGKAAPLSLKAVKKVAIAAEGTKIEQSEDIFAELWFSADHREAEAAFAEKRQAHFQKRQTK